jgi:hypothetical protein
MSEIIVSGGVVHEMPDDLRAALLANPAALAIWERITPLGRNEFICWVGDAKQAVTRESRIRRTCEELLEGKRRLCCWLGCVHRTDKEMAPVRNELHLLLLRPGSQRAGLLTARRTARSSRPTRCPLEDMRPR